MPHAMMELCFPIQIENRFLLGTEHCFDGARILRDFLHALRALAHGLRHPVQPACGIRIGLPFVFVRALLLHLRRSFLSARERVVGVGLPGCLLFFLQIEFPGEALETMLGARHRVELPMLGVFARNRSIPRLVRRGGETRRSEQAHCDDAAAQRETFAHGDLLS